MEQTPPPLPPRDATASVYRRPPDRTRPPERTRLSDQPPPLPEKPSIYDRLPLSRDSSDLHRESTSDYYMNYSNYDVLPAKKRTPVKSHSLDVVDVDDNYLRGSSASIRQFLKQSSSFDSGLNDNVCNDDDNIDDMPDTSPPPVPTNRKSFVDSTYSEIPLVARSRASQLMKDVASRPPLIREAEYVLMKPQTESDVQREYQRLSSESDYMLPSNSARSTQKTSPKQKPVTSSDCKTNTDIHPAYQIMHPSPPPNNLPSREPFTRTKSAYLQSRPAYLSTPKMEQRRGTVAQSMGLKASSRDGCSSLPRSDQNKHGQGQARRTRRSRSFDDLLQDDDDDWHMPHEAESLNDLLARAYISPKVQPSPNASDYLVPPSARRQPPPPLPPAPQGHSFSRTPSSSSSSKPDQYSEAAYLDMTQSSLERIKTKKDQSKPVAPSPDPAPPPPLPKKYILYDPNDDLVDL